MAREGLPEERIVKELWHHVPGTLAREVLDVQRTLYMCESIIRYSKASPELEAMAIAEVVRLQVRQDAINEAVDKRERLYNEEFKVAAGE